MVIRGTPLSIITAKIQKIKFSASAGSVFHLCAPWGRGNNKHPSPSQSSATPTPLKAANNGAQLPAYGDMQRRGQRNTQVQHHRKCTVRANLSVIGNAASARRTNPRCPLHERTTPTTTVEQAPCICTLTATRTDRSPRSHSIARFLWV